jgi:N-acetylglucosamine malate deacetylase 1
VRDACFLAGLKNLLVLPDLPAFRPRKVVHCMSFREDAIAPSFIVDISDVFEQKLAAIRCYRSQFEGLTQAGEVYPNGEPLADVVRHQAAHYGTMIRARYGEPFHTTETLRVEDIASLDVSTF